MSQRLLGAGAGVWRASESSGIARRLTSRALALPRMQQGANMTHLFVRRAIPARRQGLPQVQPCLLKLLRSSRQAVQFSSICTCSAAAGRQSYISQAQAVTPGQAACRWRLAAERRNGEGCGAMHDQAEPLRQISAGHACSGAQGAAAPGNRRACHRSSTPAARATSLPQA